SPGRAGSRGRPGRPSPAGRVRGAAGPPRAAHARRRSPWRPPVRLDSCPEGNRGPFAGQGRSGKIGRGIPASRPAPSLARRCRMDNEEAGRLWNGSAEAWTGLARAGHDVYRDHLNTPAFFALLPDVAGLTGLDVGCGEGHNTRLLARRGALVTGLDISEVF